MSQPLGSHRSPRRSPRGSQTYQSLRRSQSPRSPITRPTYNYTNFVTPNRSLPDRPYRLDREHALDAIRDVLEHIRKQLGEDIHKTILEEVVADYNERYGTQPDTPTKPPSSGRARRDNQNGLRARRTINFE